MNCSHCGVEFESKRATARYCSGECRALSQRARALTPEPMDEVSQLLEGVVIPGYCDCQHCKMSVVNKSTNKINHGRKLSAGEIFSLYMKTRKKYVNRVPLPGD